MNGAIRARFQRDNGLHKDQETLITACHLGVAAPRDYS